MDHGAGKRVEEQSHTQLTIKTDVEKAVQSTAYDDMKVSPEINVNYIGEEPALEDVVRSEAALLVKEEAVEHGWRDIAEQQHVESASISADIGSSDEFASIVDLDSVINIKEEHGAIDIGPTVLQKMDTQDTTNQKDISAVKAERTVNQDKINPILCAGVKEEVIEDEQRGSLTPQDSLMEQPGACTALHSLHKECLEMVCRVQLIRLDTFQCEVCDAVYKDAHTLLQHVQEVHGSGAKRSLDRHVKSLGISNGPQQSATVSSPVVYTCDYCHKTYASKEGLVQHMEVVHTKVRYRCSECNKEFTGKLNLQAHIRRVHSKEKHEGSEPRIHICHYCKKTCTTKGNLGVHITHVHASGSYKCSQCNRCFKCELYLLLHTRRIHPADSEHRIHICNYCKKTFRNKSILTTHITCVHGSGSYKCSQCNKCFKCKVYLVTHTKRNHPESDQLHTCTTCGKNFNTKTSCRRHEKRGKCRRPTASSTRAVASTSIQQRNVIIVKEEPADGELELGPTVFQHMDCNYRPYKLEPQLD